MNDAATNPESPTACRVCGRPLAVQELDGLCANCLWLGVFAELPLESPVAEPSERQALHLPGHELGIELARGGMGIVYRARQLNPPREVALKMLLPHQLGSAEMRERFQLEVRAGAALEHPAILPIYQVGEHDGLPFFTMKLATGGTLAARQAGLRGAFRSIAELVATLADAVQFAHERGVLHRDLKPSNILFDEVDRPFISDFGLAKFTEAIAGESSDLTRSLTVLGTPQYLAPEIASRGPKAATTAADIYSLGAILYELLAGRPPFQAEGMTVLLKKIVEEEPAPLGAANSDIPSPNSPIEPVPRDLEVICLKCLAKEPARRYGTARELAEDLRRWLSGNPILARATTPTERLVLWGRRNRGLAVAVGTALGMLLALIVGLSISAVRISASRAEALLTVEALEAQKSSELLVNGNNAEAIALLARRVRNDPHNWRDTARLMWALQRRQWALPARPPVKLASARSGDGASEFHRLMHDDQGRPLVLVVSTNLVLHDIAAGTNRHRWPLPFVPRAVQPIGKAHGLVLVDPARRVWLANWEDGQLRQLPVTVEESSSPLLLLFNPDFTFALTISTNQQAQLVDLQTSRTMPIPAAGDAEGNESPAVQTACFLPDNRRLAILERDSHLRIFDYERGAFVGPVMATAINTTSLAVSPDGRVLVATHLDGDQFWDLDTGLELPGRAEFGVSLSGGFLPGRSQCFAAGNLSGLVRFDPLSGSITQLPQRGGLLSGSSSVEPGGRFAYALFNRFVGVFDATTGLPVCEPVAPASAVKSGADGFATLGKDASVTWWQIRTNRLQSVLVRHAAAVQAAAFSPDGTRVVTASHDGTAQVWDARSGVRVGQPLHHGNKVWSASFSPNGQQVATASWDNTARLWNAVTGEPLSPPLLAGKYVFHVEFNPDGSQLLTCGDDGSVRIYDAKDGGLKFALAHTAPVFWAHFSPDGKWIVTRPVSGNPKLWSAAGGELVTELSESPAAKTEVAIVLRGDFSRDSAWVTLGSSGGIATVWHLPDGRRQAELNHVAAVRNARFSIDGRRILTTADDMSGQIWDRETGRALGAPLVNPRASTPRPNSGNSVRAAAIHQDGRRAVTGGSDAMARLWDLEHGFPLGEPAEFNGSVMHAEFSPDGGRLLLACFDGSAQILPLPPVLERAPDWLAPLAEALVGQRIGENGASEVVPPTALWEISAGIRNSDYRDGAGQWIREVLNF